MNDVSGFVFVERFNDLMCFRFFFHVSWAAAATKFFTVEAVAMLSQVANFSVLL